MFSVTTLVCDFFFLMHSLSTVLKVREDQEKIRIEEEQPLPAQQQANVEVPQSQQVSQPASYVSPQPSQHSPQMSGQPASHQSMQSTNYSTAQSTQHPGMGQGVSSVPHSTGQVPGSLHCQSVASIQPESEEPETDQHQPLQHTGGVYEKCFVVEYSYSFTV